MKKMTLALVILISFSLPISVKAEEAFIDIHVQIGEATFAMKLYDNDTTKALVEMLPLTLTMSELNGNEKYFYLPESLPMGNAYSGSIRSGDLMLYGSNCLVLFYEGFNTGYSYTQLGYIENPDGLADALGRGDAHVVFSLSEDVALPQRANRHFLNTLSMLLPLASSSISLSR